MFSRFWNLRASWSIRLVLLVLPDVSNMKRRGVFGLLPVNVMLPTTTFKMVETLSLKYAFPFRNAQKIKKEVRNFASDPHPPFKVVA